MLTYAPDQIEASISSLANAGSEKLFRKKLLIDTIRYRQHGTLPNFEGYDYPRYKVKFGKSYSLDFLNLMFMKVYGKEVISKWVDDLNLVDDVLLENLNIEWIFKHNPLYEDDIPQSIRSEVKLRMIQAGITPFSESDWNGYFGVKLMLERFHALPD